MQVISVVDDDPSVRSSTIDLLDSAGLSCQAFESAEAYLASGWVERTSCLILDVSMPGMTGIELHHRLVQSGHSIPVIFITAFPKKRARVEAVGLGAICCLLKPYAERELLCCIRSALAVRQENSGSN